MLLRIENLHKTFRPEARDEIRAVDDVSLQVREGEILTVNGPSGCGKTTLLLSAGGLLFPDSGSVILDGVDLYGLPPEGRAKQRSENIGFVFQQFYLVPYLDILENVLIPTIGSSNGSEKRARKLIDRFNLTGRINHKPSELSTGEKQRVALVRALINNPRILLADEPTGNLDDKNAEEVMSYIAGFAVDGGGVLLVTHDRRTAVHSVNRHFMKAGRIYT